MKTGSVANSGMDTNGVAQRPDQEPGQEPGQEPLVRLLAFGECIILATVVIIALSVTPVRSFLRGEQNDRSVGHLVAMGVVAVATGSYFVWRSYITGSNNLEYLTTQRDQLQQDVTDLEEEQGYDERVADAWETFQEWWQERHPDVRRIVLRDSGLFL